MKLPAIPIFPIALWGFTRASYLFLGHLSLTLVPHVEVRGGSVLLRPYPALDALCRWDCGWFELIARRGYQAAKETNFFPGLPLAARGLAAVTPIPIELGLLIIPNLACLVAYVVMDRIFRELADEAAARTALVVFAAYPFAFFHASGYPETLMILSSTVSVWLAMRGRHVLAGAALGLGVLCRHLTIVTGGALLVAQLRQRGFRGFFRSPALLALALPFALPGLYALYCARVFGDPLSFWNARQLWGPAAWWSVVDALAQARRAPQLGMYVIFTLLPAAGIVMLLLRRRYAELAAASVPLLIVTVAVGAFGLGRYSASLWPAFLPIGAWLERRPAFKAPLLLLLALAQGWIFFLYTHHYEIL